MEKCEASLMSLVHDVLLDCSEMLRQKLIYTGRRLMGFYLFSMRSVVVVRKNMSMWSVIRWEIWIRDFLH